MWIVALTKIQPNRRTVALGGDALYTNQGYMKTVHGSGYIYITRPKMWSPEGCHRCCAQIHKYDQSCEN